MKCISISLVKTPMHQPPESSNSSCNSAFFQRHQMISDYENSLPTSGCANPAMQDERFHCFGPDVDLRTSVIAAEITVTAREDQVVYDKSVNNNASCEIISSCASATKSMDELQERLSPAQLCKKSVVDTFKVSGPALSGNQLKGQCQQIQPFSHEIQCQDIVKLQYRLSQEQSEYHTDASNECFSASQIPGNLSHSGVSGVPCEPSSMPIVNQVESNKTPLKCKPNTVGYVNSKTELDQKYLHPYKSINSSNVSSRVKGICRDQSSSLKGSSKRLQVRLQGEEEMDLINAQLQNGEVKSPLGGISCVQSGSSGRSENQFQAHTSPTRLSRNRICRREIFQKGKSKQAASKADTLLDHTSQQHFYPDLRSRFEGNIALLSKKRRKLVLPPIPLHATLSHPGGKLLSASEYELVWAATTNCLPQKNKTEEGIDGESTNNIIRAKMRLNLATQLMQQLVHPLPLRLMQGHTYADHECTIYVLAKLAIGDSCRMVARNLYTREPVIQGQAGKNSFLGPQESLTSPKDLKGTSLIRLVQSFLETIKHMGTELSRNLVVTEPSKSPRNQMRPKPIICLRLEGSTSVSELICKICELEMLAICNRMGKHHGNGFYLQSSKKRIVSETFPFCGLRRTQPEKYVTAIPLPNALPQAVTWLSL